METHKNQKEEIVQKSIQNLHQTIIENLKQGEYYGLDQKIKNIQRAIRVSSRI